MIDEELAFIRAAATEPDDDTCRLVYADWLEEQGGEKFSAQAAFVRLQAVQPLPASISSTQIAPRYFSKKPRWHAGTVAGGTGVFTSTSRTPEYASRCPCVVASSGRGNTIAE